MRKENRSKILMLMFMLLLTALVFSTKANAAASPLQRKAINKMIARLSDMASHGDIKAAYKLALAYQYKETDTEQYSLEAYFWATIADKIAAQNPISIEDFEQPATASAWEYALQKQYSFLQGMASINLSKEQQQAEAQKADAWINAHPECLKVHARQKAAPEILAQRIKMQIDGVLYDMDGIKALIKAGADINYSDTSYLGATLLSNAMSRRRFDIAALLIDAGADVNEVNFNGTPPLKPALDLHFYDIAKKLISAGAYTPDISEKGLDVFIKNATPSARPEKAQKNATNESLLRTEREPEKASPIDLDILSAALFLKYKDDDAAFWYYVSRVRALEDFAVCPNDSLGRPSLFLANNEMSFYVHNNREKLATILGKALKWDEETPREYNIQWTQKVSAPFVQSSPHHCIPENQWLATRKKVWLEYQKERTEYFSDFRPDGTSKKRENPIPDSKSYALLRALGMDAYYSHQRVIDSIKDGANVNAADPLGLTPLVIALRFKHPDAIIPLIKAGADYKDKYKYNPVLEAITGHCVGCISQLALAGIDLNAPSIQDGNTPLMAAIQTGTLDIAKVLIQSKVKLDTQNHAGDTALIMATTRNDKDIVQMLVDAGAARGIKNNQGKTAAMAAKEINIPTIREEILKILSTPPF